MSERIPVFHHLDNSQSQRILWLLEELDIPYELKLHERHKSGPQKQRAPDELKESHPLGKAPQLITSDGRVIVESSAIALYLIRTYDTAGKFQGDVSTGNDEIRDEMLSSFANASIMPTAMIRMTLDLIIQQAPFFIRWLFTSLRDMVVRMWVGPEVDNAFKQLNTELGEQDYFMGDNPGRADFMLSWPTDFCVQREYVDLAKYPRVNRWYERIHSRAAWKQSLNKGNGYHLGLKI